MSSYLFPTFEESYQCGNGSEHSVSITANRDLLLPVTLNMAVYDEQDNLIQRSHDNDLYNGKDSGFIYEFKNLPKEKKLKAYPLVKLGDIEVRATPAIDVDRCMAKIDEVKLADALYVADGEQNTPANKFYVDVSAISDDMQDVREWGVYSSPNHLIPFKSLEDKQEIRLMGKLTNADIRFNYTNFVAETDMELGVYIKKYNAKTNQIQTLLGPLKTYTLRYDTKPSIVFSNPKIINTEVIGSETNYDDMVIHIRTTITLHLLITILRSLALFGLSELRREFQEVNGLRVIHRGCGIHHQTAYMKKKVEVIIGVVQNLLDTQTGIISIYVMVIF